MSIIVLILKRFEVSADAYDDLREYYYDFKQSTIHWY
jgi:hypothetical protein